MNWSEDFADKIVVITGGSRGIGKSVADELIRAGSHVIIVSRHPNGSRAECAARRSHELISADLANEEEVERVFDIIQERYGRIDHAFNNAGQGQVGPLLDVTPAAWRELCSLNLTALILSIQREITLMSGSGNRSILNNASIAGLRGMNGLSVYSATKHAVVGLTRSCALEFASRGVRVNAVCPGMIETDLTADFLADVEQRAEMIRQHPLGRLGSPQDVAGAALFLMSDQALFITGQTLAVDGGYTAK